MKKKTDLMKEERALIDSLASLELYLEFAQKKNVKEKFITRAKRMIECLENDLLNVQRQLSEKPEK